MENFWETRSKIVLIGTVAVLVAGIILAYALPAANGTCERNDFVGTKYSCSASLSDVTTVLREQYGEGWVYDLAKVGMLVALGAAFGIPATQRNVQRLGVAAGCAAGLALPIYVHSKNADFGAKLGSGLILFSIACIVAAVIPLLPFGASFDERTIRSPSSVGLTYGPIGSSAGRTGVEPPDDSSARHTVDTRESSDLLYSVFGPPNSEPAIRVMPPSLALIPASGGPGTEVEIIAERFPAGSAVTLTWQEEPGADEIVLGSQNASITGKAGWIFTIPEHSREGYKPVKIADASKSATTLFTVMATTPAETEVSERNE